MISPCCNAEVLRVGPMASPVCFECLADVPNAPAYPGKCVLCRRQVEDLASHGCLIEFEPDQVITDAVRSWYVGDDT